MVSLSVEQGQGGYFFGQEDHSQNAPLTRRESDLMHDSTSLGVVPRMQFQPMSTHWIAILQMVLFIAYEALMFLWTDVPSLTDCNESKNEIPEFPFYAVLHVGLWLIIFITDRVLQHHHYKSQYKGYLAFFRETKELRRLPVNVLSLANAVLLVIFAVVVSCTSSGNLHHTKMNILRILFTVEFVIVMPGIVWYLVKVLKFNRARAPPDVDDPSEFLNGFNSGMSASGELGVRDSECLDEVLEKQADMIRYLQQHNANLGHRLMRLMAQQSQTTQ